MRIAVVTVSDRSSQGVREDSSGPLATKLFREAGFTVDDPVVVADEVELIRDAVTRAINEGARVVFTTGGTGIGERDVTLEALDPLVGFRLDGIGTQILLEGLKNTPMAGFSRGFVGITEKGPNGVVIIAAPGSRGGVKDTCKVVSPLLGHLVKMLDGGDHDCAPDSVSE